MAQRDEHRLDADSGAQYRADLFTTMTQRRPLATRLWHLVVHATQPRLGHTNGRQVEPQPQVRGHTEAPWMGNALAIHHDQLGARDEPVEGRQSCRYLAKGEQPRNVGHAGRFTVYYLLHYLEPDQGIAGPGQHHYRGPGDLATLLEADVDSGNMAYRCEPIHAFDTGGHAFLECNGIFRADIPVVKTLGGHP